MWSAKLWGIALFAAFLALLGFGTPVLVPVAIAVGIIADLEGLAASMIPGPPPVTMAKEKPRPRWSRTN